MREILFRGKRLDNGEWAEGYLVASRKNTYPDGCEIITVEGINYDELDYYHPAFTSYAVYPDTVGQYTGLYDENGKAIIKGDIVDFFGSRGVVTFECGAFGVGFKIEIDYDTMQQRIYDHTRTSNPLNCCFNDNFISLWEISWNFDCEENCCHVLEVIGNIHDNPELLNKEA